MEDKFYTALTEKDGCVYCRYIDYCGCAKKNIGQNDCPFFRQERRISNIPRNIKLAKELIFDNLTKTELMK